MQKMQPVGEWFKQGFQYVVQHWLMLLKVYAWGMLMYFGVSILMTIGAMAVVFIAGLLGLTLNAFTGSLAAIAVLCLMIILFAVAGKMFYFQIRSIQNPINNIREEWRKISYKDGLRLYWVLLLCMLAGYGGMIFLLIPGLIIFTWVSLSMYVHLGNGALGLKSLMLSRDYVRGYFWPLLGRYLLMALVFIVVTIIVMLGFTKLVEMGGFMAVLGYLIYLVCLFITTVSIYRLSYLLYLDLVTIKGKLELQTTPWRTFRWGLLAFGPFLLFLLSTIVMVAINPAEQIKKAQEIAVPSRTGN